MATLQAAVVRQQARDLLLLLASLPLYALGYAAGVVVRVTLWIVAAIVEGYQAGLGK